MTEETIVRLKITSTHHSPDVISEAIGLPCDRSWLIGSRRGKSIIEEKNNGWILGSGLPKSTSLDVHVATLLERLEPFAEKILILSKDDSVEFSCVIYAEHRPALNFHRKSIQQLAKMGASLDIDLYILPETTI